MAGLSVSKANIYAVLTPPKGVSVSKAVIYAVLGPVVVNPPAWPDISFGAGVIGVSYDQYWDMPTAALYVTYSVVSGTLPDGLSLDGTSGNVAHIHGIPYIAGTFNFTLRAENDYGSADKAFTITIAAAGGGGGVYVWFA